MPVVRCPFLVVNDAGRYFFQLEINHLVTTDNHGTLMFVERVDNALEYVSIDVQIITIQLDGESSAMFAHDGMCPASPDAKVGARGNDMDYLRVLLGHFFNNSGRVVGGMIVDNENIILEIGLL